MLSKTIKFLKEVLFPVFCVKCGAESEWLCQKCFEKIKFEPVFRCPGCGKKNDGSLCLGCQGFFSLDGVQAMFEYEEKDPVALLMRDFKYRYARDSVLVWQKICQIFFESNYPMFLNGDSQWAVIPVPLFPRRERERGYNQAKLLSRIICEIINLREPNRAVMRNDILMRSRSTNQQAKLSKEERVKNVMGAFAARKENMPASAILVDDVFTSGATLFECARVLKDQGVKRVWAITLARSIFV